MNLDHPLFKDVDVYGLVDLNDVVRRFANNDESLKSIVEALQAILTATPTPPGSGILSPVQLQAAINALYDAGNPLVRPYVVSPPDRSFQEIENLFGVEPFASLIEGVKINPSQWLPLLRVFTMLKGMTFLVEDGPNYDADPTYVKDGSFFFTSVTNADGTRNLLVDATGAPVTVNDGLIYQPLPIGITPITLIEFMLRRLEFQRLRTLYRISCFEAGIDTKYDSAYSYDFLANAFRTGMVPFARRYPCGFTQLGDLLFLRAEAGKYRGENLSVFLPGFTAESGVEDRVIMDESMIQTPFGVVRIPRSVLRWDQIITDNDRQSDETNGDPVVFVGLRVSVQVVKRTDYSNGTATPEIVTGLGFSDGILPLTKKDIAGDIPNYPTTLSGTQAQKYPLLTATGHEQGRLIGYLQKDGASLFGQYLQVGVTLEAKPLFGRQVFEPAVTVTPGQLDEIGKIGELGTDVDVAPWRTFGIGPRKILPIVAPGFPGFTVDVDQGVLISTQEAADVVTWECVLPIGLVLLKNLKVFGLDNLNGCTTRFTDAWAIRTISSVQPALNTIIFDDGAGQPEEFPQDFIGSVLTIWHADGTSDVTTIIERVGDRLARIPAEILAKTAVGDVATMDRRVASASFDDVYEREVSETNFVDLRLGVKRLVDPVVIPADAGTLSPSPSPAVPWTALERTKPLSLVQDALVAHQDKVAGIASKLRWHFAQQFIALASQRQDLIDITGTGEDLQSFLVRWVQNYEANKNHEWIVGEGAIIHYPAKSATTKVSLRRYSPPVLPGVDDGLAIENVEGWGPVPVLTKYLRSTDNTPYPLRFVTGLTFVSERSFTIPGHTKLAGSFRLDPLDTWIVDDTITFSLYQTRNVSGAATRILLGSFTLNRNEASSFANATGVFRIDGDASYNPATGYVNINYNQVIDFTVDEPGSLDVVFVYHDLSQTHPIYSFNLGGLGLEVSHLFDTEVFAVVDGKIQQVTDTKVRLQGISLASGNVYIRFDRDDSYAVLAKRGIFRTKWVLRNIPWITITNVVLDANGQPASVEYVAQNVRGNMTISTLLESDKRCRQTYIPCALKYGWVDLGQTNIHTEATPFNTDPVFGFFELDSVKNTDGSLSVPGPIYYAFKPSDIDYRFLEPYVDATGMEEIHSVAIARNINTGVLKVLIGAFRQANGGGEITALSDPITLATLTDQSVIFVSDSEMDSNWILDFAGVVCMVRDEALAVAPSGNSKLMLAGYWYNGHSVTERVGTFTRFRSDCAQFSSPTKVGTYWRVGDVPDAFVYRGNTILETDRRRPPL